jgi:hypothetical protein
MAEGWVKLYRSAVEHPCLDRFDAQGVWATLLQKAAYTPRKIRMGGQMIALDRGQLAISVAAFARAGGISHKRMRTILGIFAADGMLEMGIAKGKACTVLTICNYTEYQSVDEAGAKVGAREGHSWGMAGADSLKEKEGKNLKQESLDLPPAAHTPLPAARAVRSKREYQEAFERLWATYPLRDEDKSAKADCLNRWKADTKGVDQEAVIAAAKAWAAAEGSKPYRMGLRAWLRNKAFLQQPPTAVSSSPKPAPTGGRSWKEQQREKAFKAQATAEKFIPGTAEHLARVVQLMNGGADGHRCAA